MFFWHRRISIIIVSSSRHLQRSVSPAEILHPLEASDTHSQAPPGWLTGRRDQARMLTNVVSPIIHLYWGWCINYLSIYLSIYIWVYHITYKHIQTHTNMFRIFQMVCFWVEEIQGGTRNSTKTRTSNIPIHPKGPSDTPDVIQAQKIIGGNLPIHESFINLPIRIGVLITHKMGVHIPMKSH